MRLRLCVAVAMLLLAGCATTGPVSERHTAIGPFSTFDGRLIVIEPTRRWQVLVQWQGDRNQGSARLTHAASGRIAEIRWHGKAVELRDNANPVWRPIRFAQLAEHGVVLPPQQIAAILNGHMPVGLEPKAAGRWEGRLNNSYIRLQWQAEQQRLELTDITHGRRAILIINHS